MIQSSSRYRSLLRSLFTAILQTNLSANDLRQLSHELRRGRLPDELAYMLDKVSEHFHVIEERDAPNELVFEAERIIKDRKITKSSLFNVIRSIDDSFFSSSVNSLTIRQVLARFLNDATASQARKLLEVLSSLDAPDPYLKGMTDSRE